MQVQRQIIAQQFTTFSITVPIVAAPISGALQLQSLIDSFAISVPSTAANSIFFGSDGVTVTTGLELLAGTTSMFIVEHGGRQIYEVQEPVLKIAAAVKCFDVAPEGIPFVCWDLSQIFLIAAAPTVVSIAAFKAMYI